MLVKYESYDEVLVTTIEGEAKLIKEYFVEGDRDLEDYDREECFSAQINAGFRTRT